MTELRFSALIVVCICLLSSCAGVAKISDFPKTAEPFDFDKLAQVAYDPQDGIWNKRAEYEYFIEVTKVEEDELYNSIIGSLLKSGYEISYSDKQNKAIIGERGLRLNEWNSITGVYYKQRDGEYQVFIKNAITQDITGGWRENRAKEVAIALCTKLSKCKSIPK